MIDQLEYWISLLNLPDNLHTIVVKTVIVAVVIILCILVDIVTRKVVAAILHKIILRTKTTWDDVIVNRGVLNRLSHIAPAVVVYFLGPLIFSEIEWLTQLIQRLSLAYMVGISVFALFSLFDGLNDIYSSFERAKRRPIKGYIQLLKIFAALVGIVIIITTILNKSPIGFLSGIGAMSAILILVFKDTILGFVSGIQISSNNLVQIGDWIEIPKYGADGTVIEISLQNMQIQNWDKTISTVPLYALVSDSFKNWRGMTESGGRRIKRSIYIDMRSIHFCSPELLDRLGKFKLLHEYITHRRDEVVQHNSEQGIAEDDTISGRRMTNIGTFRAYIVAYLKNNPNINTDMTFLVRHLQPGPQGLPIEIYVFSKEQEWVNFEIIQADIMDHLLAVMQEFELKVFQSPSGGDLQSLADGIGSTEQHNL